MQFLITLHSVILKGLIFRMLSDFLFKISHGYSIKFISGQWIGHEDFFNLIFVWQILGSFISQKKSLAIHK